MPPAHAQLSFVSKKKEEKIPVIIVVIIGLCLGKDFIDNPDKKMSWTGYALYIVFSVGRQDQEVTSIILLFQIRHDKTAQLHGTTDFSDGNTGWIVNDAYLTT